MLMWHRRLWLIDHGASLYFHHTPGWQDDRGRARDPFTPIEHHVLLPAASLLREVDESMAARLTPDAIDAIVGLVPRAWLEGDAPAGVADAAPWRAAYRRYCTERLAAPRAFVEEAVRVR